jgi:2-succinyl-6-hydroxy-2,4-cyclohexadiene-1-carboxylate synthase
MESQSSPMRSLPQPVPLLVGIHGWMLSRKVWAPFEQVWTTELQTSEPNSRDPDEGIPLWCPDLPGFGDRDRPVALPTTLPAYGRWLAEQALDRAGSRPIVLMGHSLGASIALHAAETLEQQAGDQLLALVMIAAGGGIYQPRPFQRLRRGGRLVVQWRPKLPLDFGPLQADERAAVGLLVNSTCRGALRTIPNLVANLRVANLWISGSRDRVMEPGYVRHLASYSPLHALITLEDCGHLPMWSHAPTLAKEIQNWLQSLASPRSCSSASSA